ncbi:enoyl-CoA hydratase-related protein [Tomitella fengzijianii]|uniref:Enoyl-CoA hydratase n=1 Tax=Tomitella fengzijianii TaxID=2597660 RepID=A0A516X0M7_9ACTN|nr:enoyl-CoA hydratase-related protein [Tomitella fengzijianii]QDQ96603.1 enoyl-CoA hydratase [Tomitella fengzijianii]
MTDAGGPDGVRVVSTAGVLTVTIDRQARMNALDSATVEELVRALTEDARDEAVRAVVLTGAGTAFCTGADLVAMSSDRPAGAAEADERARATMRRAEELIRAIVEAPVPVVAAVNGAAAGLGVSVALACDLVYAAEDAYFLLPFTGIGLMPDGGASLLVPAAVGRARANAMVLLGDRLPAAEAQASGLICEAVPAERLSTRVDEVAARLASRSRRALEATKSAMAATTLALLDTALATEAESQRALLTGPDLQEGIASVLERRAPQFR